MAASPPPFSPRDAKQQARNDERARRAQWKAQKQYWRYWRGYRRPSLIGPCILLAIGIIALLLETGHVHAAVFWGWYARWWPLLLIGIGLLALVEHFLDRNNPYAGRRSFGGIVWLVILLIFLGWASHNGHLIRPWAWQFDNGSDAFSWMGEEHDNDVQMEQVLTAQQSALTIQNPRGDVTITASADNKLHLRAHQMVHSSSDKDAQKMFGEVQPKIETSSQGAVVTIPSQDGARVDLTLEVPAQSSTTVTASDGDVTMEGLQGSVDVTDNRGDIKFDAIGGDVRGHMSHGDFSAHDIGGQAFVDGHGEDITLSRIKGQTAINGDFFGDVHLEQIGSSVHFRSSQTDLEIPHLAGVMTLDRSDLSISQASGPVRVVARSKDIDMTRLSGDLHLEDSNGDINITAAAPMGNIQVQNRTGAVTLTVPDNASFHITGSTSSDQDLQTDFPLKIETSEGHRTVEGQVGQGGPTVEITTDHGSLEIRKGTLDMSSPTPPEPPQPPGPPRHLREPKGTMPPQPAEQ
ncbi:DUF4097 family beta strand repeat-containing protein [Paracidobacterium acidisoli]|uniref:Uncharacterized protein n=1 Tax=Paracidobacterium acidisoli TaxID=2303751 RepID=A0A372IP07_9BACT|nr:DUF4097 family beta strand repeat-containing protein [Paracidobacterium acidisoli]MBT9332156.1 DUF4097 domain-containing protein [Paracidobacterium acidisoli]